jgi:hypothetical protein
VVEFSACRALHEKGKAIDNGVVRSAAKPPLELADHCRVIGTQWLREPEAKNALRFFD